MLYKIAPFIMIIMTTWMTVVAIVQLLKYRLKRKMIEAGLTDAALVKTFLLNSADHHERQYKLLKWIFLSAFGGIGLVVQQFLPYNREDSLLPYGVIIIFLSLGLALNYVLNQYLEKKRNILK